MAIHRNGGDIMPGQIHHHSLLRKREVPQSFDIKTGLMHLWQWEGNGKDTIGTSHGDVINNPALVAGKLGNAYNYNPTLNQYINYGDVVTVPASISIFVWVKSNTVNWESVGWIVSSRWPNGFLISPENIVHPSLPHNRVVFYMGTAASGLASGQALYPTDITQWNLFGFMFDNVAKRQYGVLNGTITYDIAFNFNRIDDTVPMWVGRDQDSRRANAIIDDLSIYNRVLTAADCAALWNNGNGRNYPY